MGAYIENCFILNFSQKETSGSDGVKNDNKDDEGIKRSPYRGLNIKEQKETKVETGVLI